MKLVTKSHYAITIIKESSSFNDQISKFCKQVFTCSNSIKSKHWQKIFDLFKLINKATTAMPLT